MTRIKNLKTSLAMGLMSALVFVGCSDDNFPENKFGAIGVNSLQTTSTTATAYWTIVSNGSCDGYKITINEGTREQKGAEVVNQQIDDCHIGHATFTGLKENTSYVMTTQAIPSASSGRPDAETYEIQFMTAPIVKNVTYGEISYKVVEGVTLGTMTASWDAIDAKNCGGYAATLFKVDGETSTVVSTVNITTSATTSATFTDCVVPSTKYIIGVRSRANNACWYSTGEWTYTAEFTSPAAE